MEFSEDPPKDVCHAQPEADKYKPKFFSNSALSLGKVDLTWDETDPDRTAAMQRAFESDDVDDEKLKAYFATSSDSDSDEAVANANVTDGPDHEVDEGAENDEEIIAKYRALLGQAKENEKERDSDDDEDDEDEDDNTGMEMTFVPDEDKLRQKAELEKQVETMTPWEKYLHKKKEKRKLKKSRHTAKKGHEAQSEDDDIPSDVDLNDPFFKEELKAANEPMPEKKSKSTPKRLKNFEKEAKDLSLMVMDSDDDKAHFDYKDIVKNESKRKKKRKAEKQEVDSDHFQMDLKDPRFSAIFENPKYNVDPSHPGFKKTKAMRSIVEEKQNRMFSNVKGEAEAEPPMKTTKPNVKTSSALLSLADSVASKTKKSEKRKRKRKA